MTERPLHLVFELSIMCINYYSRQVVPKSLKKPLRCSLDAVRNRTLFFQKYVGCTSLVRE